MKAESNLGVSFSEIVANGTTGYQHLPNEWKILKSKLIIIYYKPCSLCTMSN